MRKLFFIVPALFLLETALGAQENSPAKAITLDEALQIALSENVSVRIADMEIEKTGYARKGSYAALFPSIDINGSYQRTIKKQMMYIDMPGMDAGMEIGRWNNWSASVSASMPLINAQLWKSLKLSDQDMELAVEKARSSRLEMVTQVKQTYYTVLLSKLSFDVYKSVYENALENFNLTQKKYNAGKASELDLTRAKTSLANSIPEVYDSESAITLALWQLKAVMGISLDENIDTVGSLTDYAESMSVNPSGGLDLSLNNNSTMKQLAIQAEELANNIKLQKYAYIPSLSLGFSYSLNAMENEFDFREYNWSPYSYVGLSLSIPIFSGGKRLNNVRQAKVQASELELQRADTERQLHIAIRQYLNTMETATKSYSSSQEAYASADKAYDIAKKSYDVGRSTFTDLLTAQLALTQSQLAIAQTIFTYINAKADLEKILGADFSR